MNKMMTSWLGRTGMDGNGGWLPDPDRSQRRRTPTTTAPRSSSATTPRGEWVSSLDITGHEFGHGVDDHTPGGLSQSSTREFVADTFGTSTEWFDNQPAPHDVRDFLVGEEVNLAGPAEIRNMSNPSLEGHPSCYSAVDRHEPATDVHDDAGPGDHWFYLAREGTNPAGCPVSPTCNATTQLGIGIRRR